MDDILGPKSSLQDGANGKRDQNSQDRKSETEDPEVTKKLSISPENKYNTVLTFFT